MSSPAALAGCRTTTPGRTRQSRAANAIPRVWCSQRKWSPMFSSFDEGPEARASGIAPDLLRTATRGLMIDTFCGRVLYYAYLIVHRQPRVIRWDALGSIEAGEMQGRGRSDVVCFLAIDR